MYVQNLANGRFAVLAGERLYRAAKELGLADVPTVVRELSDLEAAEVTLAENLQRENLNPVEETEGVLQLLALELERSREEVVSLLYSLQNATKGKITHKRLAAFKEAGELEYEYTAYTALLLYDLPEAV